MRKVMLLAAMLAMVLAAAAPAFAQAVAIDEGDDVEYNAVCQNIIGSIGDINQGQEGDASAVATDDSAAAADVAQSQDVTIEQVNNCLNEADLDGDGFVTVVEHEKFTKHVATVSASSSSSASSSASTAAKVQYASTAAEAQYSTPAAKVLPETGGASLLALGAGALLVAGGLVARRIVR